MTSTYNGHAKLLAFISSKFAERESFTISDLRALCRSPENNLLSSAFVDILYSPEGQAALSDVKGISATNEYAIGRLIYLYRDTIKGGKRLEMVNNSRDLWRWVSMPHSPQAITQSTKGSI